jgi:hypothetical protein
MHGAKVKLKNRDFFIQHNAVGFSKEDGVSPFINQHIMHAYLSVCACVKHDARCNINVKKIKYVSCAVRTAGLRILKCKQFDLIFVFTGIMGWYNVG